MGGSEKILARAEKYKKPMVSFLRDLVAIPSESCEEEKVIRRIKAELEKTGAFDRIWIDRMGNLLGQVGKGPRVIAIDAHVDTVGVGNRDEWQHDPYEGKVDDTFVWGRGAGDQGGAIPAMVYGARIVRDLGLESDEWTLLFTFTVMEEDCDGLCWQYMVNEGGVRPEVVIVTDSTSYRQFKNFIIFDVWRTDIISRRNQPRIINSKFISMHILHRSKNRLN